MNRLRGPRWTGLSTSRNPDADHRKHKARSCANPPPATAPNIARPEPENLDRLTIDPCHDPSVLLDFGRLTFRDMPLARSWRPPPAVQRAIESSATTYFTSPQPMPAGSRRPGRRRAPAVCGLVDR